MSDSDAPYIPAAPGPEAGCAGSDHTFAGRCALVDSALVCAGGQAVDETDGNDRLPGKRRGGLVDTAELDTVWRKGLPKHRE